MRCRACPRLTAGWAGAALVSATSPAVCSSGIGAGPLPTPRGLTFAGSAPPGSLPRRKNPNTEFFAALCFGGCICMAIISHDRSLKRRMNETTPTVTCCKWDSGPDDLMCKSLHARVLQRS